MGYINNDPCLARAEPDEPIFVGLGRDPLAAVMTVVWAVLSEDCQPNGQVAEANEHAERMITYCGRRNPGRWHERVTVEALDRAIAILLGMRMATAGDTKLPIPTQSGAVTIVDFAEVSMEGGGG